MTTVHADDLTTPTLDPKTLRRAFGAYPSGVVAVAAQVGDRKVGIAASSFHLGEPRAGARVLLHRQHLVDLAGIARCGAPGAQRPRRPSRRGLPSAGGPGRQPLRRRRGARDRRRRRAAGRCGGHLRLHHPSGSRRATTRSRCSRLHAVEGPGALSPLVFHRSMFGRLHHDLAQAG